MFRDKNENEENNFWISYADLMAGLLFIFILLIGAIISKSIILKSDLNAKNELLGEKSSNLSKSEKILKLKIDEIAKLNKMLIQSNTREAELQDKIILSQTLLKQNKTKIAKNKKNLKEYKGKILILSNKLSSSQDKVKIKDDKLLKLLNAIDEKKSKYDTLLSNLRAQKAKIKSLTGIKLKVVEALKEALGNKIDIDKKTGSLRLASNILFARGEATLKAEAKVELKKAFEDYIGTLVKNKKIKPHLDKIIIEGHTDSDGSYIYNLKLSQDRALAVMEYLLSLEFSKRYNIKPLLIASGRAYLDAIKIRGIEDKEASRRIEIKFRLKNEDAMNEIEKVLDAK